MVIKKSDALEFVNELEGGWDCIVWDPPYLERKSYVHIRNTQYKDTQFKVKKERAIADIEFNNKILDLIKTKTEKYVILDFFHKFRLDADDFFVWYKGTSGAMNGRKISNNIEFINIYDNLGNPTKRNQIFRCLEFRVINNQFMNSRIAFEKPIKLYKKLFTHFNIIHVLDCFAGSYNSAKACKELGIKIDSCDKYLDPPSILRKDLSHFLKQN